MEKILVPTDFSAQAQYAMDVAAKLVKKNNTRIILLHVIEDTSVTTVHYTGEVDLPDMEDRLFMLKMIEKAKSDMADMVAAYSELNIKEELRIGNPYHSIKDIVAEHQVDLVVMGTKGASGLEEFLIGSNTEKVVRYAKCPVLTVHDKVDSIEFKKIVYATSGNQNDSCIRIIKSLEQDHNAEIHVVRINTPNSFETDRETIPVLQEFAVKCGFKKFEVHVFNDISEEEGIIHFAESVGADLIAMATHGRTGFAHLLAGSIAEDVVNHAKRPVLTYVIGKD